MPNETLHDQTILGIDPGTNVMGFAILKTHVRNSSIEKIGVVKMPRTADQSTKLTLIYDSASQLIEKYHPDILSIEEPFYGKNPQSMLKLGRAQGTAIAAAIHHGVPIHEYAPMKIKMALTGNGSASKEQVAGMLQRLLKIPNEDMGKFMDATDALAAAYCHYLQMGRPVSDVKYRGWKDFVNKNQDKLSKRKQKDDEDD